MDPMTPHPPQPEFWDYVWRIAHVLGASAVIIVGWIWARLNRHENSVSSVEEKLDKIERDILTQRVEIHRDFVTKSELRTIIHDAIDPMKGKIDHIETMLDLLVQNHIKDR